MAYAVEYFLGGEEESNRVLNREIFLYFLDLEVKRSRRYQNFFCIMILRLKEMAEGNGEKALQACYERLAHLLQEEVRDSDILGTLSGKRLAVILPYADMSAGGDTRSRFEDSLQYYDFNRDGYQVVVEQICFPSDGTETSDLVRKVIGTEATNPGPEGGK
jgi:GGDEF domain-containing protein